MLNCLSASCLVIFVAAALASEPPDDSNGYTAIAMVNIFKQVCIDKAGDPKKVSEIKELSTLQYEEQTISAGKEQAPYLVHKWTSPDIVISQHGRFLKGLENQCNASFNVTILPLRSEIMASIEKIIGSPPINAADAFKKNGKPNKEYRPKWSTVDGIGREITVVFNALDLSFIGRGQQVQLSALLSSQLD